MGNTWQKSLLLFLQGALIGTGAILPGISGGVLCVAFGIYEPMMNFLSHPFRSFKQDCRLLLPVLAGGGIGFVLLAKAAEGLLSVSAVAAMFLFCGLICGTVPDLIHKSVSSDAKKGWSAFIITLIVSFVFFHTLSGTMEGNLEANTGWYVFCGAIWGLSMVVPGLSSSSILLFMGLYQPMAEGIGNLDYRVLLPLLAGFIVTIGITAKIISHLLERHYAVLSKVILGFVITSVLMITPTSFANINQLLIGAACFAGGFIMARWMDICRTKTKPGSF